MRHYSLLILIFSLCLVPSTAYPQISSKAEWEIKCPQKKTCSLIAEIKTKEDKVVSSIAFLRIKANQQNQKKTIGILRIPLGFHVPSGIFLNIDEDIGLNPTLIDCKKNGCRAIFPVPDNILEYLKKGKTINIVIVDSNSREKLGISYSLNAFAQSYEELLEKNK